MTEKLVELQMEPALMRNPGKLTNQPGSQQLLLSIVRLRGELSYKSEVKGRAGQVQMDAQEDGLMDGWVDGWVDG